MFQRDKQPDQNEIKSDIINSQKRAMRILAESELVASKVNVSLKEQGETIVRSRQVTNKIGEDLKKTDKDIRIIKSWFGPFINKLAKSNPLSRANSLNRGSKGSLADSGNSSNYSDYDSSGSGNTLADHYHNQLLDYNDAIEDAQAHFELNEELVAQNNENLNNNSMTNNLINNNIISSIFSSKNNNMLNSEEQQNEVDEEIDNNFNQISSCLNRLKTIGLDMNEELGQHKDMIDDLKDAISKTEDDTEKVTRIMRRFEI